MKQGKKDKKDQLAEIFERHGIRMNNCRQVNLGSRRLYVHMRFPDDLPLVDMKDAIAEIETLYNMKVQNPTPQFIGDTCIMELAFKREEV